jgi:cellulose synthase/poly-beta-1,6-N-acetylglucosamine synthase-like glycosyltransferase
VIPLLGSLIALATGGITLAGFASALAWLGWGIVALQTAVAGGYVAMLLASKRRIATDNDCPRVEVVLCLRGSDPFLRRCLEGLLAQDYPRFAIRIVIDSRGDPAWRAVDEILGSHMAAGTAPRIVIEELRDRPETCSLKNAALIQAYGELGEDVEVVATIDADCTPHRTWLRELVAPLADPRVGAATGNRWYMPGDAAWGGLVRHLWNAAAIVPMYWHRIAWGGTLAVRAKFVRDSDYCHRMSRTLCEDTMLFDVLRRNKLRLQFVPSLIMVNRESSDIPGYFRFCRRQMLIVRYHSHVALVWGHGLISTAFFAAAIAVCLFAAVTGRFAEVAPLAISLGVYYASMLILLVPIEGAVRRIVRARGEPTDWYTPAKLVKMPIALLLTQSIYGAIAWSLPLARRVDWRGIRYTFLSGRRLRRENYEPYRETLAETQSL